MVYIIILLLVVMALAITTAAGITTVAEQIEGLQDDINKLHEDMKAMEKYLDYQIWHHMYNNGTTHAKWSDKEGDNEREDA